MVDHWILLGVCWWSEFDPRCSSVILVCSNPIILLYLLSFSSLWLIYLRVLHRLCVVFLAFDVFFVVFCVALACIIGIAVCCCLPCIIAILYAVADQVPHLSIPALPWVPFSNCYLTLVKDQFSHECVRVRFLNLWWVEGREKYCKIFHSWNWNQPLMLEHWRWVWQLTPIGEMKWHASLIELMRKSYS